MSEAQVNYRSLCCLGMLMSPDIGRNSHFLKCRIEFYVRLSALKLFSLPRRRPRPVQIFLTDVRKILDPPLPVRSGVSTRRKVYQIHGAIEENKNRNKCWLCRSAKHWPDQCQKLAAMTVDERLMLQKKITHVSAV